MPKNAYVSTSTVAESLGVSVSTVKRWVDEGILPAHKTAGGHRKLLLADVLGFVRNNDFPRADLSRLYGDTVVEARDLGGLRDRLIDALRSGDSQATRSLLRAAYREGIPIEQLADDAIAPAMHVIGHEWSDGRIEVFHEHRAAQQLAAVLFELKAEIEQSAVHDAPLAVGGASEGDFYLVASLLAQLVLLGDGWRAVNIGANTPFTSFRRALEELNPRLVWLSVTHLTNEASFLLEYRSFFEEAHRRHVAVAVGGQGIHRGLLERIPYTIHGENLTDLATFAQSIHPRRKRPRRGRPPQE